MVKKLLVLLVLIGIFIIGCSTKEEIKQTNTQLTVEQDDQAKSEFTQEIIAKEDVNLLARYNYPINIQYLDIDSSKLIEAGKTEGYAIRIFISPATCNGIPLKPGDGCKGKDRSPPVYNFINVNYNLSDYNNEYPLIEGAWEMSPKWIAINEDNIVIEIERKGYTYKISCGINITHSSCSGSYMIFEDTEKNKIKEDLIYELNKLGVINNISEVEIIIEDGFIRPVLTN